MGIGGGEVSRVKFLIFYVHFYNNSLTKAVSRLFYAKYKLSNMENYVKSL